MDRNKLIPALLIIGAAAVFLRFLYCIFIPQPAVIQAAHGNATVFFTANRNIVLLPYDCVDVQWELAAIDKVFLNGEPTVGSGSNNFCLRPEWLPTLRVDFQDESREEYTLPISVLTSEPANWLLALFGLSLAFIGFAMLRARPALNVRWLWGEVEYAGQWAGIGLLLVLLIFGLFMDRLPLMNSGSMGFDIEKVSGLSQEQIVGQLNADAQDGIKIKTIVPPDSVTLIPFRISHSMVLHAVTYPRRFYWVGDLAAYLDRYVGNPDLSFVGAGKANAERLDEAAPFQNLYLYLDADMMANLHALGLEDIALETYDLEGEEFLIRLDPNMSSEQIETMVDEIVGSSPVGTAEVEDE